jgi:hypothetical protein
MNESKGYEKKHFLACTMLTKIGTRYWKKKNRRWLYLNLFLDVLGVELFLSFGRAIFMGKWFLFL